MDTFTNVVICCYMLTKNPALYFVNATESFAIILAMVFAVIDGLFLPIYLLQAAIRVHGSIGKNKKLFLEYFEIFSNIRQRSVGQLMYDSVFIFRRIALVATFTLGNNSPILQVFFNNYLSLACACYITLHRPLKTPFLNQLEIFNEVMNLFCCYHLYIFTEWIGDP